MTIDISEIRIYRDGGTIEFTVDGGLSAGVGPLVGVYRLDTPWRGDPRALFLNDRQLPFGGPEEAVLLTALSEWLSAKATPASRDALGRLDALDVWRNLDDDLARVVPLHRVRTVIRCLEARTG